jgi:hypothetical protein
MRVEIMGSSLADPRSDTTCDLVTWVAGRSGPSLKNIHFCYLFCATCDLVTMGGWPVGSFP